MLEKKFIKEFVKLDPISFIGVGKLLGVDFSEFAENDENAGARIIEKILVAFQNSSNRNKKLILKYIKRINKEAKK